MAELEWALEDKLIATLKKVAPGTALREGLENILRAKTGGLIMVCDSEEDKRIVEGGFFINAAFSPANLYELAKMDGAIILSNDAGRILQANTQLVPHSEIVSLETGIRHRTAERAAKDTKALIIAISQRRGVITIYQGSIKYVLRDPSVVLVKANQAIQTLEKYKEVLILSLNNLSLLEYEDMVILADVCKAVRRIEMVRRVVHELEFYLSELGTEGRMIKMQLDELMDNVQQESSGVIDDYKLQADRKAEDILDSVSRISSEDLPELHQIARALGYTSQAINLDSKVSAKGCRILKKIPRLPELVVQNLVNSLGSLNDILSASLEKLDEVEGIGEVRAKAIQTGLRRYHEQLLSEQHI